MADLKEGITVPMSMNCAQCGKSLTTKAAKPCTRCNFCVYCSKEHQNAHREAHRRLCRQVCRPSDASAAHSSIGESLSAVL